MLLTTMFRNTPNYSSCYIEENFTICAVGDSALGQMFGYLAGRGGQGVPGPQAAQAAGPIIAPGPVAPVVPVAPAGPPPGAAAAQAPVVNLGSGKGLRRSGRKRPSVRVTEDAVEIGQGIKVPRTK